MRLIGIDDVNTMNWDNIKTISDFDGDSSISDDLTLPAHGQNGSGDGTNSSARYIDEKNISEISAGHPTTSTSLLIESLVQLLCVCLEKDPKVSEESYRVICEQLSKINLIDDSYAMKEFEEMRSQYQMQIYKIIRAVGGHTIPKSLPTVTVGTTHPIETCWSRYHREFEEVEYIAGGGFGRVFKARHKLDCIEYAIKQIKIHSTTIKLCHLAEVKTIASLNHPNVVQYKAAWLEPYVSNNNSSNLMDSETYNASEFETNNTSSAAPSLNNMDLRRPTNDDTSSFIQFERSENNSADTDKSKSRNQILCKYDSASLEESQCRKQNLAILYIQMSLCQMTLKNWLDNRNACNSLEEYYFEYFNKRNERSHLDIVHDIFFQILSGLNYIHSRGIIHHDIKPSNIFLELDSDGRITAQLGDFGLACPLQDGHQGIILGTPLYAAPEQLNGECNPKSDIYSLGIVLIELLIKFGTNMERVRTIESARKGTLPSFLNKKSIHLLQSLLSDEAIRPNTKDLMEVFWKINLEQNVRAFRAAESYNSLQHDKKITELLNQIKVLYENTETINREKQDLEDRVAEQSSEISELTNALSEKDREIALLRMQLLHYECSS